MADPVLCANSFTGAIGTSSSKAGRIRLGVFTSARAVTSLADHVATPPRQAKVAAVGAATAGALKNLGWMPRVVGEGGARELTAALADAYPLAGTRILFPAASRARQTLEQTLAARGARVDRVEAYQTLTESPDGAAVRNDLDRGVDVVTFTSPSAVESLRQAIANDWPKALHGCGVATIGPTTADAARGAGLCNVVQATEPTVDNLIATCVLLIDSPRRNARDRLMNDGGLRNG